MWSSTEVRTARPPSTASKHCQPLVPSPPSRTSATPSAYTLTLPLQTLVLFWHKSGMARSASSACASRALNQAEKSYPATKWECLAIVWAVAKFRPYLMAMPFEVYTDHYTLQWLKTMRMGSALLHCWSAALEEYDFTVHHRPGKVQTHVDALSRLPVGTAPPEDTLLHI